MQTKPMILVAIADPANPQQPGIVRASQLAEVLGAQLVLFHAAFDSSLTGRPFFDSKRLAASRGWFVHEHARALERHARPMRSRGLKVDVNVVWEEPAHEAIIRAALRLKAGYVVAGKHEKRSSNRSFHFRPTDWELMRLCPRPLLLVHPSTGRAKSGPILAALDPTHGNNKHVSLDEAIATYAAGLAAALQVDCHAVHVVGDSAYPLGQISSGARKRVHHERLVSMRRLIDSVGATQMTAHVVRGNVPRGLSDAAERFDAQILAMGVVSRRWLKRFVIGDTAEHVIHELPCDLLLIKPDNFRVELGRRRREEVVLPKAKGEVSAKASKRAAR